MGAGIDCIADSNFATDREEQGDSIRGAERMDIVWDIYIECKMRYEFTCGEQHITSNGRLAYLRRDHHFSLVV